QAGQEILRHGHFGQLIQSLSWRSTWTRPSRGPCGFFRGAAAPSHNMNQGIHPMKRDVVLLDAAQVTEHIGQIDVPSALRRMFLGVAQGKAAQPPQLRNLFPDDQGNFISYLGILAEERVFGAKLSPYIRQEEGALVTAWTLMMSMDDGQPRLLCEAGQLTVE